MQYGRGDVEFKRGTFRVRGETIDIFPSDQDSRAIRLLFFGDEIEEISEIDPITGAIVAKHMRVAVYPVSHYVTGTDAVVKARKLIFAELKERLGELQRAGKLLEAQRLEQRTLYDLELMEEIGFCSGIENYSRHMAGRAEGLPPATLIDYFPKDFLLVIDESHITVPQISGMYRGDRSRKMTLVDFGFRLPSALDNRPLNREEFWQRTGQCIFVSATPGEEELQRSEGIVIEQINRPTGLLDPEVIIRPATNQVDDLLIEVKKVIETKQRVLVTTLTKRMSEDLSKYMQEIGIKAKYLHSDIDTIERVEILRGLRRGDFDVLIGINLLREGLDLVEVALVAILDADKEGFLRSHRSLIQTMGRAARNLEGRAILYADKITNSMQLAIGEVERRRKIQAEYNRLHNIIPYSAKRSMESSLVERPDQDFIGKELPPEELLAGLPKDPKDQKRYLEQLKKEMFLAAAAREFEKAAGLRDKIHAIQAVLLT
jgi:excinuclease ABC subunit B